MMNLEAHLVNSYRQDAAVQEEEGGHITPLKFYTINVFVSLALWVGCWWTQFSHRVREEEPDERTGAHIQKRDG